MPPLLEARGLAKSYVAGLGRCWARVQVLDALSLTLLPGERVVISGAPGSGKTTLLHCLTGLRRPDAGQVAWHSAARAPFTLCRRPAQALLPLADLAIVEVPDERWAAEPWLAVLESTAARAPGEAGWLAFARDAAPLAAVADRSLVLRGGALHAPPRAAALRVAERVVG